MRRTLAYSVALIYLVSKCDVSSTKAYTHRGYGEEMSIKRKLVIESDYKRYEMPPARRGESLYVSISVVIRRFINVDHRKQRLTMLVWLYQQWTDSRLTWDPAKYSGIKSIIIDNNRLWVPELILYNRVVEMGVHNQMHGVHMSKVDYTGLVSYNYPDLVAMPCRFNLYYFPFDEQHCALQYGSWHWPYDKLRLRHGKHNPADIQLLQQHVEWNLREIKRSEKVTMLDGFANYSTVVFLLDLKRKPLALWLLMYLPNLTINIITILQFLLPCDSLEKATLGITAVTCLTVYLRLLVNLLPMADTPPFIVIYTLLTTGLVALSLCSTVFILSLHYGSHNFNYSIPGRVRQVFLRRLACIVGLRQAVPSHQRRSSVMQNQFYEQEITADIDRDSQSPFLPAPDVDSSKSNEVVPYKVVTYEVVPNEVTPDEVIPNAIISDEVVPDEAVPDEVVPDEAVPDEVVPDEAVPDEVVPDEIVPHEVVPNEVASDDVVPDEVIPDEVVLDEVIPNEVVPDSCYIQILQNIVKWLTFFDRKGEINDIDVEKLEEWHRFATVIGRLSLYAYAAITVIMWIILWNLDKPEPELILY